ncbi:tetratricopeptide repeat protein [Sulfurimonas sp.]|uniref:tetratricopeptide repeat protein n=1 Tax=Sulfurimonas sp. TaxID=2022749 RepID=UPI002607490E|nr:tetratricopeptide repeat protein [Sulfurimonas sp.]MCW8894735.1 tetratricopeptide repeat protein [Sulfurimonas sp.]MCW9067552.1 tetratricopeptide repeat protein [Sulfurimonas sp.]
MKILFVFLLPIYLFSSEVDVSNDLGDNYSKGMQHYKVNDFTASYDFFSKIYLEKLSDIKFNFYFGRSAYETGHYQTALAAFERVEMQDGSNLRNRLEMARTYFMLKMYEDSENAFKDVLSSPNIPDNIRTNIELSLSRVSKVQQKSFTYATALVNILYDSNVNYGSIGDYEYGGGTHPQVDEISDNAVEAYVNLVNIYDIGDKNGFAIKNSLAGYLKDYNTQNDYNVKYLAYMPSLIYQETKYLTELVLGVDTLSLGQKNYLSTLFIIPRFEYKHTDTLKSISYFKYQVKTFKQTAQHDLDASRYELSYGLQTILSPRSYFQANVIGINEHKKHGTNILVDFNEVKLNAVYASQFTSNYGVELFLEGRNRLYDDYSSNFDSTRNDIGGTVSVSFSAKILPTLRFKIKTAYEYINSNQDRFTYAKHTATAGFVKTF